MGSAVRIRTHDTEWYIRNEVNTEGNNTGASDDEGYLTNTW